MRQHRRVPVVVVELLLLRLCLCLLLVFLVPRFSAVLDFGQELADVLDVFIRPKVNGHAPAGNGFWSGNFLC